MTAAPPEGIASLKRILLSEAKVSDDACSYIIDTLKCESVSDLANLRSTVDYVTQIPPLITDNVPSAKAILIQVSRTGLAWELCRADLTAELTLKSSACIFRGVGRSTR